MKKVKNGSGTRCVSCGTEPLAGEVKGSFKHPYCKDCFKRIFNNDYAKYDYFMLTQHG